MDRKDTKCYNMKENGTDKVGKTGKHRKTINIRRGKSEKKQGEKDQKIKKHRKGNISMEW